MSTFFGDFDRIEERMLGAESEDDLRETHGRYFFSIGEMWERAFSRSRERLAAQR